MVFVCFAPNANVKVLVTNNTMPPPAALFTGPPGAEAGQSAVAPLREALPPSRPVALSPRRALPSCSPSEEKYLVMTAQKRMMLMIGHYQFTHYNVQRLEENRKLDDTCLCNLSVLIPEPSVLSSVGLKKLGQVSHCSVVASHVLLGVISIIMVMMTNAIDDGNEHKNDKKL